MWDVGARETEEDGAWRGDGMEGWLVELRADRPQTDPPRRAT
jgi:hypothetical protein